MSKYINLVRCVTDIQCYNDDKKENADVWAIHRPKLPDMILACIYVSFIEYTYILFIVWFRNVYRDHHSTHPYLKYNSRENNNHQIIQLLLQGLRLGVQSLFRSWLHRCVNIDPDIGLVLRHCLGKWRYMYLLVELSRWWWSWLVTDFMRSGKPFIGFNLTIGFIHACIAPIVLCQQWQQQRCSINQS